MVLLIGLLLVIVGGSAVLFSLMSAPKTISAADWMNEPDDEEGSEYEQLLQEPFVSRIIKPFSTGLLSKIASVTPTNYLDRIHKRLVLAGLSGSIRAEEFATVQVLSTVASSILAIVWVVFGTPTPRIGVLILVLLPGIGALLPQTWLTRKVNERQESIFRDLPDVLDLLAISVEAGMGFEGALDVVCSNFDSPLALEFSRTLKEMELGLPRREALQNMKRRTEVPELSNFVLALTQADALGMPVGRVLHTQAAELRIKRRQWAREKAAKLPVKILFPLVLFIFPAILIVVLGPAAVSIMKGLN